MICFWRSWISACLPYCSSPLTWNISIVYKKMFLSLSRLKKQTYKCRFVFVDIFEGCEVERWECSDLNRCWSR
jgi:hypothetical protein